MIHSDAPDGVQMSIGAKNARTHPKSRAGLRAMATGVCLFAALSPLASAQQDQGPILRPKPKPTGATLLVICDISCDWTLDGTAMGSLAGGESKRAPTGLGQHLVAASTADGLDKVEKQVDITTAAQTIVRLELQPVQSTRLKSEQRTRDQAAHVVATKPIPPVLPSSILQPALLAVQDGLMKVQLEQWKSGTVREEATTNVSAIQRDLQYGLPPLLKNADAEPAALSKSLELMRHLDALYDVLLRVDIAARIAAPYDQANQLNGTLSSLENARLQLGQRLVSIAIEQENQLRTCSR